MAREHASKEERFALAAAFSNRPGSFLFGLRVGGLREYPRAWSLPSCYLDAEEFARLVETGFVSDRARATLFSKCFRGSEPCGALRFLRTAVRDRPSYRLHLALVGGALSEPPDPCETKYERLELCGLEEILGRQHRRVSTCVSLLIQELVAREEVDSAVQVLEIAPDVAASPQPISERSPEELWRHAVADYAALRRGESGSDGELIRSLTIDRYLDRYLDRVLADGDPSGPSILDLGCGGADLVAKLARRGCRVSGADLAPDPLGCHDGEGLDLRACRAEDLERVYAGESFSLVLMNLVAQWLPALEPVARAVAESLLPGGKVVVTLVPPELAKNGCWSRQAGRYRWVITEPMRRAPMLAMVNRTVGPLWFFPRTTPETIRAFAGAGLLVSDAEYLYIDSFLDDEEKGKLFRERPDLRRHEQFPAFLVLELTRPRSSA